MSGLPSTDDRRIDPAYRCGASAHRETAAGILLHTINGWR
jgi:hypothetical protein